LVFFDVAGEDCESLSSTAKYVTHLFDADGIVLLIDPNGLPSSGSPLEAQGEAPLASRRTIDVLADAIERVTGEVANQREQALVIAVAKGDSVCWSDGLWPPTVLHDPAAGERSSIVNDIAEHSRESRSELQRLGGIGIIAAAESRFGAHNVSYARISATGEAPADGKWGSPEPIGCTIPIAQILLHAEGS
jgi:hypothetical protein